MWKASRPAFKTFHPHRNAGFNPELLAQVIHTGIHMALLEKTPRSHDETHHVFPMKLAFSVRPPVLGHIQISHHFGEIPNHIPSYPIISRWLLAYRPSITHVFMDEKQPPSTHQRSRKAPLSCRQTCPTLFREPTMFPTWKGTDVGVPSMGVPT